MGKKIKLSLWVLMIISVATSQVQAQNSEKKIKNNREKIQKADSIQKTFRKDKKRKSVINKRIDTVLSYYKNR